ncbi:dysbindin-like [Biomphalaria glabrata]|uniref:Dysbindin-like n=1 Tax=Biomphalaria glabrata TaxID=6526 RepID=A0A9U8ECC9_BIOGL|nr:dysbindin-like [Biomphalaria glabrata]
MSVLKILKGTFHNVQQDIVDGLRTLTSSDGQPRHEQLRNIKNKEINLNVGADLLYGYQQTWSAIQAETKDSAKKAEEVSTLLQPMFQVWDKCGESVTQLEEEVKNIPSILNTLEQLQKLIAGLRQDFIVAEKGLEVLENLCEEQELKKNFLIEQKKLTAYRLQKESEAEKIKVVMAQDHAKKMAKLESQKRINLQERAEVFTSAFQEDLEYYRTHGHPDRVPTEFPKVSSLSEIVIEEDKQELDSFLGPPDGSQELSGENAYIEDDYLGDFSVKEDTDFIENVEYINSTIVENMAIVGDHEDYEDSPLTRSFDSSKGATARDKEDENSEMGEQFLSRNALDNKFRTLTTTSDSSEHDGENHGPDASQSKTPLHTETEVEKRLTEEER